MKKYLKIWHQLRYYKFLVYLKIYDYFKSMTEGNISQELRLKKIDETIIYFVQEIDQNELMSNQHKRFI